MRTCFQSRRTGNPRFSRQATFSAPRDIAMHSVARVCSLDIHTQLPWFWLSF